MAGRANSQKAASLLAAATALLLLVATSALAVDPAQRTADMADSWLVLYNTNDASSVTWAAWYQAERGIPDQNMVGLDASTAEHLDTLQEVQDQIITPVRDLLANDPQFEQSIMGIILGYHLPGHYASRPQIPNTGGFSVTDALQDMFDDGQSPANQFDNNFDNPHVLGNVLPPGGRLTKAAMLPNRYMVARIDAPSLGVAQALTDRAKAVAQSDATLFGQNVFYDYFDPSFPAQNSDEWFWLRQAVESPDLASLPWAEFDLDGQSAPALPWNDAFRFGIYKLFGWSAADFAPVNPGSRVLAYQLISFGAITVRSTITDGGVYVPNAIEAGYAAAIGATGEPGTLVAPFPDTILAALGQGWTLGEAFYLAKPFDDLVWNLVGDPFLTLPNWFDQLPSIDTEASDMTVECDGSGNVLELSGWLASNGGAVASDNCSFTWSNDFTALSDDCGATGSAMVTFTANDKCGNSVSTSATFTIEDTTGPEVTSSTDIDTLWPPNHQMVDVGLSVIESDICDPSPAVTVAVYSDEDDEDATGDGNHTPDATEIGLETLQLRAERKGDGDGRVYLILATVQDECGNVSYTCNTVTVSHDRSAASKSSVAAQAAAAEAECLLTGGPPADFFTVGDGPDGDQIVGVDCGASSAALLLSGLAGLQLIRTRRRARIRTG